MNRPAKHARKPLPAHLPRETHKILPRHEACLWRIVFSPSHMACNHCYIRFFMSLIPNGLLVLARHSRIYLCAQPQNACVRSCYPMRQNPQKCCLPCRLGTIIDFRVSGRHFAPALAKRSVKQTPHCLAAHGEHTASEKLAQFALRFRTEIHHFAWRLLSKCRFWRKPYRLEGLLKRCFLGEVLFPARTALCKI